VCCQIEGIAQPSFVSEHLEAVWSKHHSDDSRASQEDLIRDAAAAAYEAGSSTVTIIACISVGFLDTEPDAQTAESLHTFFLAMVLHPDVQRKAQAEIDTIVGHSRLPDFSDRPSLPYLDRIITEVHRWHPVTPLAQEHRASEDVLYRGYVIPKGATITPNAWYIDMVRSRVAQMLTICRQERAPG
jgi:cytochrome P450